MSPPNTPEAPALCPDGTLKDASKIPWFHSPSDVIPIKQPFPLAAGLSEHGRSQRIIKLTEKAAAALNQQPLKKSVSSFQHLDHHNNEVLFYFYFYFLLAKGCYRGCVASEVSWSSY